MKTPDQNADWTRRQFLRGAGLFGAGGAVAALSARWARAAAPKAAAPPRTVVPYDVERFRKTDPKLVHYEPAGTLRAPHPEPTRLGFGPEGRLYVSAGRSLTALNADGTPALDLVAGEEIRSFTVAADGTIYLGLRSRIEVFGPGGRSVARWEPPAQKVWFTSLAAGENDLFASDATNRIVYRFDRSGKLLGRIGAKNKEQGIRGFLVPSPYFDLEIGSDGLLWVVNPGHHQLEAYTFDGRLETAWGEPSFGIAGFCGCCNPSYFTRLPDGGFVTSEKGLPRVKVYSAKGAFESVVAGVESFPKYTESLNAAPIPMDIAVDTAGRVFVADVLGNEIRIYRRKPQV